jgi:glycosyltransferase involved in cell wall biosynthesis
MIRESTPLVSVVVPVYNAERHLGECVESLLGQTLRQLEVILVNDGSEDGSGALCDSFAARDPRVVAIHTENGGAAAARNRGLEEAQGDYVYFVDADDWVEPCTVESCLERIGESGADLAVFGYYKESSLGGAPLSKPILPPDLERAALTLAVPRLCASRTGLMVWNKLIRKSLLDDHHIIFSDVKRIEDMSFMLDVYRACERVVVVRECFYHYRLYPHSGQYQRQSLTDHVRIFEKYLRLTEDLGSGGPAEPNSARLFALWFAYVIPLNIVANRSLSRGERIRLLKEVVTNQKVLEWLRRFAGAAPVPSGPRWMLSVLQMRHPHLLYALAAGNLFARRILRLHLR